jgi:hypothetical protein
MPFPPTSYYSRLSPLYTRLSFRIGPYPTEKAEVIQGNCGVLSVAPWGRVALAAVDRIDIPAPLSLENNLQPCISLSSIVPYYLSVSSTMGPSYPHAFPPLVYCAA